MTQSPDITSWNGPERVRLQTELLAAIDSKVGVVLGFSAVSMAEMLGYLVLASTENSAPSPILFTPAVVLVLSLGFFAGIVACLIGAVILVIRSVEIGPTFGFILSIEEWTELISRNEDRLTNKAKKSTWCIGLVLLQMTSYGLAAFMLFINFVPIWGRHPNCYPIHFFRPFG